MMMISTFVTRNLNSPQLHGPLLHYRPAVKKFWAFARMSGWTWRQSKLCWLTVPDDSSRYCKRSAVPVLVLKVLNTQGVQKICVVPGEGLALKKIVGYDIAFGPRDHGPSQGCSYRVICKVGVSAFRHTKLLELYVGAVWLPTWR